MKNRNIFHNNIKLMHVIAGVLVVCMLFADASLYTRYSSADQVDETTVITEDHPMDTAYADGNYDGTNSDNENGEERIIQSTEGKHLFNILEILPTEKKAVLGYTIGGCEPFTDEDDKPVVGLKDGEKYIATPQQMRSAYMEALFNPEPGVCDSEQNDRIYNYLKDNYSNYELFIKNLNEAFADSGETKPIDYSIDAYNGYYKYIGGNKGVYRITDKDEDPKFYSRFYFPGYSDYNYIFVYSDAKSSEPDDVNVENQKRVRYINNEKFLKDYMGISGDDVQSWKENHVIEVTSKTPKTVTDEDIEKADAIFINNGNQKKYYEYAANINNVIHGRNMNQDVGSTFSETMDFENFEQVLKIYERVVVREDVAIIVEKLVCPNATTNGFTTNMHKLMCMLFYVNKGSEMFAGRDIFTDYLKRYTSNPGTKYMALRDEYFQNRKSDGNGGYTDDPLHPDYRAISLRTTDNKDNPSFYYMHTHHWAHVGHPLVLSEGEAITGGYFNENGELEPTHNDPSNLYPITLKRLDTGMFESAGISYKEQEAEVKDGSKYYRQVFNGNYKQDPYGEYIKIPQHNLNEPPWWVPDQYVIPSDGNYGREVRYKKQYDYVQDPSGEYIKIDGYWDSSRNVWVEDTYELAGDTLYTKKEKIYYHEGAYESMSNTTDFVYIDNDGKLIIDDKYSSKNGYWFCIDYDGNTGDGFAFRRRLWDREEYSTWPWDADMSVWMMKRKDETPNSYDCNMHMWYDYNAFRSDSDRYTAHINDSPFAHTYKNETLMEENGMLKGTWVKDALEGRKVKREIDDPTHVVEKAKKDYYLSMNILNGDGVNKKNNNKVLYYNIYEEDKIKSVEASTNKAYIPINIRLKTSCELESVQVMDASGSVIATYQFNKVITNENSLSGTGGRGLELTRPASSLDEHGNPKEKTSGDGTPIHTFEGSIFDVMSDNYLGKRNYKVIVQINVKAPDGSTKSIQDSVTIVKRDFFMLD